MDTSLQGSEGQGVGARASTPFVVGQIVHVDLGAGLVGRVTGKGVGCKGEPRIVVEVTPSWRHFAEPHELRPATGGEVAKWFVRSMQRAALAAL